MSRVRRQCCFCTSRDTYDACAFLLASNYGLQKGGRRQGRGAGRAITKSSATCCCQRGWVGCVVVSICFVILARTSSCYVGGNQYNLARHGGPLFVLFSHVRVRAHASAPCRRIMERSCRHDDFIESVSGRALHMHASINCSSLNRRGAIIAPTENTPPPRFRMFRTK